MSIEQNVQALTAAIVALTETLAGARIATPSTGGGNVGPVAVGSTSKPAPATSGAKTDTVADPTKTPTDSAKAIGYTDVAAAANAYAKAHGRAKAEAVIKPFGITKMSEAKAKPETFGALIAAFEAATLVEAGAV